MHLYYSYVLSYYYNYPQVTIVIFATYTASREDHSLAPSVAFVALSLLDIMKGALNGLPRIISFFIRVSDCCF